MFALYRRLADLLPELHPALGPVPMIAAVAAVVVSLSTSIHILLHKRDSSSIVAWIGLVWMSPLLGPTAYVLLGINRVQRKAVRLLGHSKTRERPEPPAAAELPDALADLRPLARAVGQVTTAPLVGGNRIEVLRNGDEAYPAMLAAIDGAERSVSLLTYIFDDDAWGQRFVAALQRAHDRGAAVRVLVDGIGARRASGAVRRLRRAGVATEVFLWSWAPWKMALVNLRNHRKLLVVDGRDGFTGGINIREAYVHNEGKPGRANDLHFSVQGPVVRQLQEQFAVDWAFTANEALEGAAWFPDLPPVGSCCARAIPDGPDEDLLKLPEVLFQGIAAAKRHILVLTPYFVPPLPLATALGAAAQRGVRVEVVIPENNEPAFMNRVALDKAEPLLARGVAVGLKPGPFEHSKLFVVDDAWVLLGSTNWDPRSLRLNFELNVEAYSPSLAEACRRRLSDELAAVRWLTLEEVRGRSTLQRLIDTSIRLFEAYL